MSRPPHPIVAVVLSALQAEGAHVQPTRCDHEPLHVVLELLSHDGRRVTVTVREES